MAVHTARLAKGASGGAGVTSLIYTSPPGVTTIVKSIHIATLTATADVCQVSVGGPEPGVINVFNHTLGAGGTTHSVQPYLVLAPGDRLFITSQVTANVGYWLSGTRLQGVAL
jgi:hypothetical protein